MNRPGLPITTIPDNGAPARAGAPKRVALAALVGIVALNVWTGSPLLALWVASRVQGSGPPSMTALGVFVLVFAVLSFGLYKLLMALGAAYDSASGRSSPGRQHAPWLRSMRAERDHYAGERPRLTAVERIVAGMVILVFVLFEIWFFFLSGSPVGTTTGRAAVPQTTAASAAASTQEGGACASGRRTLAPHAAATPRQPAG